MSVTRLVLAPHVGHGDVAAALAAWDGPLEVVPGLDGEPLLARWRRDGVRVRLSALPDIGLRVLEVDGATGLPEELSALALTGLGSAALRARSPDLADALGGVTALGLLGDAAGLPSLAALVADPAIPAPVRGAAEMATRRLGLSALEVGAERLAWRRRQHPDQDPVLGLLGSAAIRRQALRAWAASATRGAGRNREVILAGLADPDWEVRWSSVIAAHDLGEADALVAIRRCPLGLGRDGVQRQVLETLREVVAHRLAGSTPENPAARMIGSWLDRLGGLPTSDRDVGPFLLVQALRTPLPDPWSELLSDPLLEPPTHLPPGYAEVPAVPHWLGGAGAPLRQGTPAAHFAVAVHVDPDVTAGQVEARLVAAAREAGVPVRLPTADELEVAVRGPDGRRFPWGNAREPGWRRAESPWGLARPGHGPEWVWREGRLMALPPARRGLGAAPVVVDCADLRPVLVWG